MSSIKWVKETNAIGIIVKRGNGGGGKRRAYHAGSDGAKISYD